MRGKGLFVDQLANEVWGKICTQVWKNGYAIITNDVFNRVRIRTYNQVRENVIDRAVITAFSLINS
jgi:hypothetical protein